jgi:hypothetical protein
MGLSQVCDAFEEALGEQLVVLDKDQLGVEVPG